MPPSTRNLTLDGNRSTRNRVLRAAAKLFATNGFRGTSMRQIATRAKVNEVTIFRLFNSKHALYREVLEHKLKKAPQLGISSELNLNNEQTFRVLAQEVQQVFDPEFIRLVFFTALENPEDMRKSLSPHVDRYYGLLADCLEKQMSAGALREVDPRVMAKALVALLVYDRISSDLQTGPALSSEMTKSQTSSLIEIWLHGVTRPSLEQATS